MPMTTATSSVADLVLRMSDGDPAVWEEIVRRYGVARMATATATNPTRPTVLRLVGPGRPATPGGLMQPIDKRHPQQQTYPTRIESHSLSTGVLFITRETLTHG